MAKTFLTNINLKGNQLLNAVIQPSATAPSALSAGQLYYNTQDNLFYYSTGTGTSLWSAVGVQYIESVDPVFTVTDKTLYLNIGSGGGLKKDVSNNLVIDYTALESQLATDGFITSGSELITSVDSTNFTITDQKLYLNSEIEVQKTSYWRDGTQQGVIAAQSDSSLRLTAITGQLQLESNAGDVRINPESHNVWFNNNLIINGVNGNISTDGGSLHLTADNGVVTTDTSEFHTTKVELWNGGDTSGSRLGIVVAHPTDGSLSIAASNQLVLEAHSGNIYLNPSTNTTAFGNELYITTQSSGDYDQTIGTNNGSLVLQADSGVITTRNQEIHTRKTEYWYGGDAGGYQRGIVSALSSGEFTVVATTGDLGLESNNGNITLAADGNVQSQSSFLTTNGNNITSGNNIYVKNGIYLGGTDTTTDGYIRVQDSSGNNVFTVSADGTAQGAIADIHGSFNFYQSLNGTSGYQYGSINFDNDSNLVINANQNNLILTSDSSHAYIGTVSAGTKIATISDIQAAAQGLSVLGSVRYASTENFDITTNASSGLDGISPANGDRVLLKNQSTATENGIYIYNSGTQTLIPSTNAEDTDLKEGSFVFIEEGSQAARGYIVTSYSAGATTWTQFSAAGEYTASHGVTLSSNDIQLNLASDGGLQTDGSYASIKLRTDSGLSTTSSGLAVNAGTGIAVSGSSVSIDTANGYGVRKYASVITGNDAIYDFTKQHNLNTKDIQVRVYQTSAGPDTQWADVEVDIVRDSTDTNNKVHIIFATPPAAGTTYGVVIVG